MEKTKKHLERNLQMLTLEVFNMELSDEIRYLVMEIENNPMQITLEEIVKRLKEFEEIASNLENTNEELKKEIQKL